MRLLTAFVLVVLLLLAVVPVQAQRGSEVPFSVCPNHRDEWSKIEFHRSQQLIEDDVEGPKPLTRQTQFDAFLSIAGDPFIFWGVNEQGIFFWRNLAYPPFKTSAMHPLFEVVAYDEGDNALDRYEVWWSSEHKVYVWMQTGTERGVNYYDPVLAPNFACIWIVYMTTPL